MAVRVARRRRRFAARPGKLPPAPVQLADGERLWCLAVPFRVPAPGASWDASRQVYVYVGATLPVALQPFRSEQFSWQRWMEDDANEAPGSTGVPVAALEPRPLQLDGAAAILAAAATLIDGQPARGMLITDDVGTGKTLTAWMGILAVAQQQGRPQCAGLGGPPETDHSSALASDHPRRRDRGATRVDLHSG